MEYKVKTLTKDGATMFAQADAQKQPVVVDEMVISDNKVDPNSDLTGLTIDDFTNNHEFDASNTTQNDTSFTVVAVMTNKGFTADYNVNLIGLLAHIGTDTANEKIIAIATGDDPFTLPQDTGTPVQLVPAFTTGFGTAANVTVTVSDEAYVLKSDLDNIFKVNLGSYTPTSELTDYISSNLPAGVAKTDAANTFTKQQTLAAGAVNGAGQKYVTEDTLNTLSDTVNDTSTGLPSKMATADADKKYETITHASDTYEIKTDTDSKYEALTAPNLIDIATDDWIPQTGWIFAKPVYVEAGEEYKLSAEIQAPSNSDAGVFIWPTAERTGALVVGAKTNTAKGTQSISNGVFGATTTGLVWFGAGVLSATGNWSVRHLTITQSKQYIPYEQAQFNRHGSDGLDKKKDIVGTRNYALKTNIAKNVVGDGTVNQNAGVDSIYYTSLNPPALYSKFGAGTMLHISYDWTATAGATGTFYYQWNNTPWGLALPSSDVSLGNGHYSATATITDAYKNGGAKGLYPRLDSVQGTITISNFHFTVGTIDTDGTPAPEDKVNTADTTNWQKSKITADDGSMETAVNVPQDLFATILAFSRGLHTICVQAGVKNSPEPGLPLRGLIHITNSDGNGENVIGDGYLISMGGNMYDLTINTSSNPAVKFQKMAFSTDVQAAINQAHTDMLSELTNRGYPASIWTGTQAQYDAMSSHDNHIEYRING